MSNLVDCLKIYKSKYEKIRLGSKCDGGYVFADLPGEYDLFISCGIGDNIDFEKDFLKKYPNVICYAFDGTINNLPEEVDRLQFIKKNIYIFDTDTQTNLHDLIEPYSNIFLKMDIESYEYRWLHTLSRQQLKKFKQIIIEFHYPFKIYDTVSHFDITLPIYDRIYCLKKLAESHYLVHLHPNTCSSLIEYEDILVPEMIENTYIRHDVQENVGLNDIPIPHPLDMPNQNGTEIYLSGYPYSTKKSEPKFTCIHRYLTQCKSNPQPPGLADFLRGTITLYNFSKKYNYNFFIDYNSHPIFKYFIPDSSIYATIDAEKAILDNITIEMIPPIDYENIYININDIFKKNNTFFMLTNSFYKLPHIHNYYSHNPLNDEQKYFLKRMLTVNSEINELFLQKFNELGINKPYICLHVRVFDASAFDMENSSTINDTLLNSIQKLIDNINTIIDTKIIILSNHSKLSNTIASKNRNVYSTNTQPIHLGSLSVDNIDHKIKDTLVDMLFLINSSQTFCINEYDGPSGFSEILSHIYDIPYIYIKHDNLNA